MCSPLTPWKLPGGLLWLSSSSGLCSTSQRASRLGRRMRGHGGGQGSAAMLEYQCLRGMHGAWWRGFSAPPGLMTLSAAAKHERYCKMLFCVQIRFHKRWWPFCSPASRREDDARAGPLVPPCRAPFGNRLTGMLPASLPEEVTSGSKAWWPSGSHRTRTCCSCEPEPRHGHRELGVAVLLSSLRDEQSYLRLAR